MKKLPLDKVQPGEVLASDVYDAGGNQLLKAGSELTKVWLSRLRNRKIDTVNIEDAFDRAEKAATEEVANEIPMDEADDPMALLVAESEVLAKLDKMLVGVGDESLRAKLRTAASTYLKSRSWNPEV